MAVLRHTKRARADLLEIWIGIAAENPGAADRVFDRLEQRVQILKQWPQAGVACPAVGSDARMLVEHPYLVFYRIVDDGAQIVRVLHGARDIGVALFLAGIE